VTGDPLLRDIEVSIHCYFGHPQAAAGRPQFGSGFPRVAEQLVDRRYQRRGDKGIIGGEMRGISAEHGRRGSPLVPDGDGGSEYQGRGRNAPGQLQTDQGLARAGWCTEVPAAIEDMAGEFQKVALRRPPLEPRSQIRPRVAVAAGLHGST
jgi:hypothetical protein